MRCQRIATAPTLDFPGQPGILGFLIRFDLLGLQTLGAAFQPQVCWDDSLMGRQYQMVAFQIHLLAAGGVLALVVVAAICSDKQSRIIMKNCSLIFEELIDI